MSDLGEVMRFKHSSRTAICGKYTSLTAFCQISDLDQVMRFRHSSRTAICGKYTSITAFSQISDLSQVMRFWHSSHTAICGKYTSLTAFYQVSDLGQVMRFRHSSHTAICVIRGSKGVGGRGSGPPPSEKSQLEYRELDVLPAKTEVKHPRQMIILEKRLNQKT